MKNFKIFIILLVVRLLYNDLNALPIYAAQWTRYGQTVTLYGDRHIDHPALQEYVDAFISNLFMINKKTTVLIETVQALDIAIQLDENYGNNNEDNRFIAQLGLKLLYPTSKFIPPHISIKNADKRIDLTLIEMFKQARSVNPVSVDAHISPDGYAHWERIKRMVPVQSFYEQLEWPIDTIDQFIEDTTTTNCYDYDMIQETFGDIIQTIKSRQALLLHFLNHAKMSDEDLEGISIDALLKQFPYAAQVLLKPFWNICDLLQWFYCPELLDANVLWHIAGKANPDQNIVIVAGDFHIQNIERFLENLGYRPVRKTHNDRRQWYNFLNNRTQPTQQSKFVITDCDIISCGMFGILLDQYINQPHAPFPSFPDQIPVSTEVFAWLYSTNTTNSDENLHFGVRRQREEA